MLESFEEVYNFVLVSIFEIFHQMKGDRIQVISFYDTEFFVYTHVGSSEEEGRG